MSPQCNMPFGSIWAWKLVVHLPSQSQGLTKFEMFEKHRPEHSTKHNKAPQLPTILVMIVPYCTHKWSQHITSGVSFRVNWEYEAPNLSRNKELSCRYSAYQSLAIHPLHRHASQCAQPGARILGGVQRSWTVHWSSIQWLLHLRSVQSPCGLMMIDPYNYGRLSDCHLPQDENSYSPPFSMEFSGGFLFTLLSCRR